MGTLRQIRNFWLVWVSTILLACASDAGAQTNYKVTDQGTLGNDNLLGTCRRHNAVHP